MLSQSNLHKLPRLALLAGGLLAAALGAPAAAATWDQTLSRAVAAPAAAKALPASTMMNVHVTLKPQSSAALNTLLRNLYTPGNPQYGRYLTPAQFTEQFAPSAAQAQKVVDYLN